MHIFLKKPKKKKRKHGNIREREKKTKWDKNDII